MMTFRSELKRAGFGRLKVEVQHSQFKASSAKAVHALIHGRPEADTVERPDIASHDAAVPQVPVKVQAPSVSDFLAKQTTAGKNP
ncbi:hypothetical protein [Roseateles depolymerans]|nr:hypothetical protein [Roseateles depolymerans]